MTSRIVERCEYNAWCDCGNLYGSTMFSRAEAQKFIREYPTCWNCEATK